MTSVDHIPAAAPSSQPKEQDYSGQVVYLYAYDVAYDMTRHPIRRLLGQEVVEFAAMSRRPGPKQGFFYRPQMVRLPALERQSNLGPVRLERTLKLFPVGSISIAVRVEFQHQSLRQLVSYYDLKLDGKTLQQEVLELAGQVLEELRPYCIRPVSHLRDEEMYTVFCVHASGLSEPTESWLAGNRRVVAALLTQEANVDQLSRQESRESTYRYLSYYQRDVAVIDWDAALVVDEPANLDETLHVMELANVQLVELEAYDRFLDEALERAYRDLSRRMLLGRRSEVMRPLREIRIDLARLSDELSNITKFFGDWHLARIFQSLSARFHLDDWHRVIDEKLKTLDSLYQLHKQEQSNQLMMILEIMIVLLFIIDLVFILTGAGK